MLTAVSFSTNPRRSRVARAVAWATLISIILTMAVSTAFVLSQSNHIHDRYDADSGCVTCAAVQSAIRAVKVLAIFGLALSLTISGFLSGAWRSRLDASLRKYVSPVTLKVRLNN
ncbi:hypothetical protein FACS1894184_17250 [Clostridia bacterium]|nr:hypothetical protein FACS1894184_17250 [Clostridia bacterium]